MRSHLLAVLVVLGGLAAEAQERKFPYEALVELEDEFVRSGPGSTFYPTAKLRKGEKVLVHRHDPGGWCMISPPPGSFSWIKAEHVKKSGESAGVLKANKVVVHIGSTISPDEFTTIQGNLSMGEAVEILGERMFPFEDGPKLMYKISPVRREWRWIARKSIVPADAIQSSPFPGSAPRKSDGGPVAEQPELDPNGFTRSVSTGDTVLGADAVRPGETRPRVVLGAADQPTGGFQERLDAIDEMFRDMVKQEPSTWNLNSVREQYTHLDNEATQPAQSRVIAVRLDAVDRYEKTHQDYLSFLKISEAARQRDAQLAQQQREAEALALGGLPGVPTPGAVTPTPATPVPVPAPGTPVPQSPAGPGVPPGSGSPPPDRPAGANPAPRFAGAGMVVSMAQSFPGGPQYALVVPGGKLLAYLVPGPGVDLRQAVNQTMGIHGERNFRQEWGADVIVVRGFQPVQLRAAR